MAASPTVAPASLLRQVAVERQTGVLVVGGHPGGTLYVLDGRVIYAESPAAPGVGELLTSSGRLAGRTWQNALDLGTSTARVGRLLVEQGHLTQGELELCVLGATYDAAYFALAPASPGEVSPVEFLSGATHWLGPVVHIDPAAIEREVARRIQLLAEIHPDARVDVAPVIPVQRPPRERITITAAQWELLIHADGQRTPADLALLLGKAGYATIQELRRLAAAGLIEKPAGPRADTQEFVRLPRARGTAVDAQRPVVQPEDAPAVPVIAGSAPVPAAALAPPPPLPRAPVPSPPPPRAPASSPPPAPASSPAPVPSASSEAPRHSLAEDTSSNPAVYRPPRLARRKPGAKLPKDVAGEPAPIHTGTDEVLLKRIRTALRALR